MLRVLVLLLTAIVLLGAPRAQSAPQDHEPILSPANQGTPATPSAGAPTPGQDPPPVRRVRVADQRVCIVL